MGNLTDAEKLKNIIKALEMSPFAFSKALGYKSTMSIYSIINGRYPITDNTKLLIRKAYPEVNEQYIEFGTGEIINKTKLWAKENLEPAMDDLIYNKLIKLEQNQLKIENKLDRLLNLKF